MEELTTEELLFARTWLDMQFHANYERIKELTDDEEIKFELPINKNGRTCQITMIVYKQRGKHVVEWKTE